MWGKAIRLSLQREQERLLERVHDPAQKTHRVGAVDRSALFADRQVFGLTVAALFVLRRKAPKAIVYRTPGYPLTPIVFLLLIALLLFLLGGHNPKQAIMGVGVVALGLPVYYLLFRGYRA